MVIADGSQLMTPLTQPSLIFTWGNPSRGDDAIGPRIYEMLQAADLSGVDLLTDFQLQIEHAIDLENRDRILFIDASTSAEAPFELVQLKPEKDHSYTTHAMTPASLLSVYSQVNKQSAPPSFMLSIRGYSFGLGLPLSDEAENNLEKAYEFIINLLGLPDSRAWLERCNA